VNSTTTPTVSEIAAIWADVLQLASPPGPADNFFSLGGDSLLMTMVLFRVNEAFRIELPPVALMEAPELGAFGTFVESFRMGVGQDADSNTL
jgi:acyl carrier protein